MGFSSSPTQPFRKFRPANKECQEHYPVYTFSFVFPFLLCSNPHSFIMASYNPINHLTPICQPHDFIVSYHDCSQPIVSFVGFHVCFLLETKYGLCAGLCAGCLLYIVCPSPEESPQPKVLKFSSGMSSPLILSPFPLPLCCLSFFIAAFTHGVFLSSSLMQLYTELSIGDLFSITWPTRQIYLYVSLSLTCQPCPLLSLLSPFRV
jgi:hypothetical protein